MPSTSSTKELLAGDRQTGSLQQLTLRVNFLKFFYVEAIFISVTFIFFQTFQLNLNLLMSLSIMLKLIFTADQLPLKLTPALKEVKFDSKIRNP